MARPRLPAARAPTPGPWVVHGAARIADTSTSDAVMADVEPAGETRPGGFAFSLYRDRSPAPGDRRLPLASGIPRLADATLMAAAPDLAAALLALLTSPDLMRRDLDPSTRAAITTAWELLVRVAPHLEI